MDYGYQFVLMSFKCDKMYSTQAHTKMYPNIHFFKIYAENFQVAWAIACSWKAEEAIPSINDPWCQGHYFNEYLHFIFWNPKLYLFSHLPYNYSKKPCVRKGSAMGLYQ